MNELEAVLVALGGAPDLAGARCKGRWDLWDEVDDPEVIEYTTQQCLRCPVLAECWLWIDSLKPSRRPIGVCAGEVYREPVPRQRKKAS
jgi:WhiB family redox-sensing transcriptional regulator